MTWHLLMLHVTVKDGERALLTRDGKLERVLAPGRHRLFDPRHALAVEVLRVVRAEFPAGRYAGLKAARPDLAAELFEAGGAMGQEVAIGPLARQPLPLLGPQPSPASTGRSQRASMSSASTCRAIPASTPGT